MDLIGELVKLRAVRAEDGQALIANLADPEVVRFLGGWAWNPYGMDEFREFLSQPLPRSVRWAVEARDGGDCIGVSGLHDIDDRNRNCLWGVHLGPPSRWGRGYGTEVCRLATGFAFQHLGMEKVSLFYYEGNARGRRAYEKAGYRQEGALPRDTLLDGGLRTRFVMSAFRDHPLYA